MKIENAPKIDHMGPISGHHPHGSMPPHGTIHRANPAVHHKILMAMAKKQPRHRNGRWKEDEID